MRSAVGDPGQAQRLGVTRQALNNLVNAKAGISPEMSIRLSKAFGCSAEVWLGLQMHYDLAQAQKTASSIKVLRIKTPVGTEKASTAHR